ncbi:homoserine O-succinyltransferase [Miniphocaeibacter massiliensis]|uniref:homoserine O-succinyltransferase n=1 Tax=Miniphocaeibacter massiliensis TaxID=2041841 RepID=UPI000C1C51CB|nr:homoserine O-succinyltransferase [Miniphocaeibacter massiliensis]
MPIIVPNDLPASEILKKERIFVMDEKRALTQDIRPLELAIINLMPTKVETETQLLRRISNTALQVKVDLVRTMSYESKNTNKEHLEKFYVTIDEIKNKKYDAMIITGAPVELMDFEEVDYWKELVEIMEFARKNVFSTLFICWASQAALYHYYGINKKQMDEKLFGVYEVELKETSILTNGFDESFYVPHSRYTYSSIEDMKKIDDIQILASSDKVGMHMAATKDNRFIFVSGHGEYDTYTLDREYKRDVKKGLDIDIPVNYYKNDNPKDGVSIKWKAHSNLFFSNWLNCCVYQDTPFILDRIQEKEIKK